MNLKKSPQKKNAFLAALAATCSVRLACEAADISRQTAYVWRALDEEFAIGWEKAKELAADALEDEAVRRAVEGYDETVFYQGVAVGTVRKYSDKMLTLLLEGARPDKYHRKKFGLEDLVVISTGPDPATKRQREAKLAQYDEFLEERELDKKMMKECEISRKNKEKACEELV